MGGVRPGVSSPPGAPSLPWGFLYTPHGAPGCRGPQFEHRSDGLDLSGTDLDVANEASSREPEPPAAENPHAGSCRYPGQVPGVTATEDGAVRRSGLRGTRGPVGWGQTADVGAPGLLAVQFSASRPPRSSLPAPPM